MKLGVFTVLMNHKTVEEAFKYFNSVGIQAVEIGAGGYPGTAHMNPTEFLSDPSKIENFKALLEYYNLNISAFSVHSNHVHPLPEIREKAHKEFIDACKIAEKFGVDTVVTFSGCPGGSKDDKQPNWVTCSWPSEYYEVLKYQWDECLIPYWQMAAKQAAEYGIKKIALEMHPGFCVYNPGTLLKLREAVGSSIGANFDPSHLFWQGIDPVVAVKHLKGAIYHFHAKDTKIDNTNRDIYGVLDSRGYDQYAQRSWNFRTVGYGHDYSVWKDIISALRIIGYDGSISIEHEDPLMSSEEGLEKAVKFLKEVILFEQPSDMWWV